jgi:ABC-type Na+ efflux pump permease subunit
MKKVEKGILGFIVTGVVAAIIIAAFISPFASAFPDGLEKVAEGYGFIDKAATAVNESFFIIRDYSFAYIANEKWQGSIAGLLGVLIILVFFSIIYLIYRAATRKRSQAAKTK